MDIHEDKTEDVVVLALAGRLDALTAGDLRTKIFELIDGGEQHVLLDLASLDYVSSAGLRVLLAAQKRLAGVRGSIALCSPGDHVEQVLHLCGFSTIFPTAKTREDGLKEFPRRT